MHTDVREYINLCRVKKGEHFRGRTCKTYRTNSAKYEQ